MAGITAACRFRCCLIEAIALLVSLNRCTQLQLADLEAAPEASVTPPCRTRCLGADVCLRAYKLANRAENGKGGGCRTWTDQSPAPPPPACRALPHCPCSGTLRTMPLPHRQLGPAGHALDVPAMGLGTMGMTGKSLVRQRSAVCTSTALAWNEVELCRLDGHCSVLVLWDTSSLRHCDTSSL